VLLVRLRSLGDSVLMTPVPTALKQWRPSLHVAVLVEEPFGAVFAGHPGVDDVIALPERASVARRARLIADIRRARFDMAFNMHSGSTAGLLTALSGAPVRVAYARARFSWLCNVRLPEAPQRVHTVRHQLALVAALGIPVPESPPLALSADAAAQRRVGEQMAARGLRRGGFIVLQPFSKWPTKEWERARFVDLARWLRDRHGVPILVFPASFERRKLEELLGATDDVVGMPDVPLQDLIAWVSECGLFVGHDSGPAHVAAALGKKVVVIFGSADPTVWHPWGGHELVKPEGFACVGCPGDRCYEFSSPRCIESVTLAEVKHAVERASPRGGLRA
jgi:ADP-heptose:LPS heptosyltransferase